MNRYVRGVLLPSGAAPALTVRQALFSIWGGLGLLLATLLLMRLLVLPMSVEQPVTLRLVASVAVAVGCVFAVSMMAAGVRNRIVQMVNELAELRDAVERAQGRGAGHPRADYVEDPGEDE